MSSEPRRTSMRLRVEHERTSSVPPAVRRAWERVISREEVFYLLSERRYMDLLARLTEARASLPYDLELLRSVRVLEHRIREDVRATG